MARLATFDAIILHDSSLAIVAGDVVAVDGAGVVMLLLLLLLLWLLAVIPTMLLLATVINVNAVAIDADVAVDVGTIAVGSMTVLFFSEPFVRFSLFACCRWYVLIG